MAQARVPVFFCYQWIFYRQIFWRGLKVPPPWGSPKNSFLNELIYGASVF